MYVLGQGGVNSYSQVERTTPYTAVAGANKPVPKVGAREQVVAQVQRQSIMGNTAAQDPDATAVYPSPVVSSSYPTPGGSPASASASTQTTQQIPQAVPTATPAAQSAAQPAASKAPSERRPLSIMAIVLVSLGVIAAILLGIVIFVFTRGYEGPAGRSCPPAARRCSA